MVSNSKGRIETHAVVCLRGKGATSLEPGGEVQNLGDVLNAAVNAERHEARGKARSVAEKSKALALELLRINVAENAAQTAPHAGAVHVSAVGGNLDRRVDTVLELLLGQTHEGLLENLVGQGLLVVHIAKLRGDLGESREIGVSEEVVVEEAGVGLLDGLAGGGVEGHVVEAVERKLGRVSVRGSAVGDASLALVVVAVGGVKSLLVAVDGVVTIDDGVLASQIGLVEVVDVVHVGATEAGLSDNRGVRADEHGNAASTTGRTSVALGVESDVASDDNGVTAVPGRRLDPVDGVEEGVGATVASIDGVNTFNALVVIEELHEDRLDGLGLVENGLGTDLEAANRGRIDIVVLEEARGSGQGEGVDVCIVRVRRESLVARGTAVVCSPSRSSQKAILVWPRPMVYFPVLTPSNFSSSDCSTYWKTWWLALGAMSAVCPRARGG